MTKYVVNSGGLSNVQEKAPAYFHELFKNFSGDVQVLWCFFAYSEDKAVQSFDHYKDLFLPSFPDSIVSNNVLATTSNFTSQVLDADVIYIHGGDFSLLKSIVATMDLQNLFSDKTVGLNSASGMLMAHSAWSCDTFKLVDGLQILPFRFVPHYLAQKVPNGSELSREEWHQAKAALENYGDTSLPVLALEEGDFVVFEV